MCPAQFGAETSKITTQFWKGYKYRQIEAKRFTPVGEMQNLVKSE